jgi:hypothetical protein
MTKQTLLIAAISFAFPAGLAAQEHAHVDVYRAASPIVIDGKLDEPAWKTASRLGDFHFLPPAPAVKQQTVARIVWDDQNLYVGYYCIDKRISAYITERHGPVSRDDCVEIFLSPNPAKVRNYYTFEINAVGTMLNRCRTDWWTGPPTWEPEGVRYRASWQGQAKKDPSPDDDHWILEMAIPFRNFSKDARTPPLDGDEWRLNLNRLEGLPRAEPPRNTPRTGLSTWSPLPADVRSFHSPEWFGWVRFRATPPPR